jgi:hypothetical protein
MGQGRIVSTDNITAGEADEAQLVAFVRDNFGLHQAGIAAYYGSIARSESGNNEMQVHRWPGVPGLTVAYFAFTSNKRWADTIKTGDPLDISISLQTEKRDYAVFYYLTFWTADGRRAMRIESPIHRFTGDGKIVHVYIPVERFPLGAGIYRVSISVYDESEKRSTKGEGRYDVLHRVISITVVDDSDLPALATFVPVKWEFS